MTDADALKTRILAAVEATPSPTRSEGRRRSFLLLVLSITLALLVFETAGGLSHSAGRPMGHTVEIAVGWALFCGTLSWLVLWRGRATMGRRPAEILVATLLTPIVLVAWLHAHHGTYTEPFERVGWRCFSLTVGMAMLPLGSLLALRNGTEPRNPWALGAAIGAVSGAWAGLLVDLWCPLTNFAHVVVGHACPVGLLIALGARMGRSRLGPRVK